MKNRAADWTTSIKLQAPTDHPYGDGWMVGKSPDGRAVFTNGHFMVIGEPPAGDPVSQKAPKICELMAELQKNPPTKQVAPVSVVVTSRGDLCARFKGGTLVQLKYLLAIRERFPAANFFHANSKKKPIVAIDEGVLVGAIMPLVLS